MRIGQYTNQYFTFVRNAIAIRVQINLGTRDVAVSQFTKRKPNGIIACRVLHRQSLITRCVGVNDADQSPRHETVFEVQNKAATFDPDTRYFVEIPIHTNDERIK